MDEKLRRQVDEQRKIFDAVTKEWLDEKFAIFGRWSLYSILATVFVWILHFIWSANSNDLRIALEAAARTHDLAR